MLSLEKRFQVIKLYFHGIMIAGIVLHASYSGFAVVNHIMLKALNLGRRGPCEMDVI